MTGLWIALAVVAVALLIGGVQKITDGRARRAEGAGMQLSAAELGSELGSRATFVQFSTSICAPCRATARLLATMTGDDQGVRHVEVDAERRMDLVERFGVTRTPTVLLLDGSGTVRFRFVGPSKRAELAGALTELAGRARLG